MGKKGLKCCCFTITDFWASPSFYMQHLFETKSQPDKPTLMSLCFFFVNFHPLMDHAQKSQVWWFFVKVFPYPLQLHVLNIYLHLLYILAKCSGAHFVWISGLQSAAPPPLNPISDLQLTALGLKNRVPNAILASYCLHHWFLWPWPKEQVASMWPG